MVTTTGWLQGLNPETQSVMNYMMGVRTKKQIVWEFFWLREEAVYDDEWVNVIDFINDFKDTDTLKKKWVHYVERFKEFNVSEEEFNSLFYWKTVDYGRTKWPSNTWITWKTETKQGLSNNSEWANLNKKTSEWTNTKWRSRTSNKRKANNKK